MEKKLNVVKLNSNESLVYLAVKRVSKLHGGNNGEYSNDDVFDELRGSFQPSEVKGYLSSLVKKGLIRLIEDGYYYDGQVLELTNC